MGDSFARVSEELEALIVMKKASTVVELLESLSKERQKQIDEEFRFVHVLVPKSSFLQANREWSGSVNAIRTVIAESEARMNESFENQIADLEKRQVQDSKLEKQMDLEKSIDSKLDPLKTTLEATVKAIEKIEKVQQNMEKVQYEILQHLQSSGRAPAEAMAASSSTDAVGMQKRHTESDKALED